ncbi:30S ribosome-binding factor RbfA [Limibaculum sp. M0105]|uniref:Ribosome-binding factor A n=1 Tax=Thermohalobaculum xanthum TaxID=2753746 RepID=A0A8J7MBG6_9RHOB|nr:30S ribosome-binding factor RbfA [Thermohalobaculum xanthum]MBK0401094.1 30S ribosome-binding factor RbfA [Thermohalobaculum xanthum]
MAKRGHERAEGPSQRQLRVGETIRRALSGILLRGEHHVSDLENVPITVGEVRISPDLRQATVYVMPLGGRDAAGALAALNRARAEFRHLVSREITLKFAPDLHFALDRTYDQMDDTRRMLSNPAVKRDLD